MKKIVLAAATAGLMSLAACSTPAANNTTETTVNDVDANAAVYNETDVLPGNDMMGNEADMNASNAM